MPLLRTYLEDADCPSCDLLRQALDVVDNIVARKGIDPESAARFVARHYGRVVALERFIIAVCKNHFGQDYEGIVSSK